MRTISRCRAVPFLILLTAGPLLAQERCEPTDTMAECFNRYTDTYMAQEQQSLQEEPTGVDTGGANLATNTMDFSPLMALTGLLGQGTGDGSATMVFNLNFPFSFPFADHESSRNAKLQAIVNTQPQLSGALRSELQTQQHNDLISPLEQELGGLDDYALRFTYSYMSSIYGRSFEEHEEQFRNMCTAAWSVDESKQALPPDMRDMALEEMSPEIEEQTRRMMEKKIRHFQPAVTSYHMLLDNQPQFYITAEKRFRDPLIGTDELAVMVKYEWSSFNLNAATDGCDKEWKTPECLDKYTQYVKKWKEEIEKGSRLSFSGKYVDSDGDTIGPDLRSIDPDLPTIDPIVIDSARKLELSLGWSRKWRFSNGEAIKLDLVGTYEDVSDDLLRQDRGIARLTLTRNIGEMSIPIGIVYANHGEFLGDVDARLSAHVGLTFKMPDMNGGQ